MRFKLLQCFCLFHLMVLTVGLVPSRYFPGKFIQYFLSPYSRLTAAGASYGFFSPNVGNQLEVKFETIDATGNVKPFVLERSFPQEAAVRIGNMYRILGEVYQNEKLRRSVAASLTTEVFERNPEAKKSGYKSRLTKCQVSKGGKRVQECVNFRSIPLPFKEVPNERESGLF